MSYWAYRRWKVFPYITYSLLLPWKGLRTAVTAVEAETAARASGIHICELFHIPHSSAYDNMNRSRIAESTLQKLEYEQNFPEKSRCPMH